MLQKNKPLAFIVVIAWILGVGAWQSDESGLFSIIFPIYCALTMILVIAGISLQLSAKNRAFRLLIAAQLIWIAFCSPIWFYGLQHLFKVINPIAAFFLAIALSCSTAAAVIFFLQKQMSNYWQECQKIGKLNLESAAYNGNIAAKGEMSADEIKSGKLRVYGVIGAIMSFLYLRFSEDSIANDCVLGIIVICASTAFMFGIWKQTTGLAIKIRDWERETGKVLLAIETRNEATIKK